jgi:hypothetical protein
MRSLTPQEVEMLMDAVVALPTEPAADTGEGGV